MGERDARERFARAVDSVDGADSHTDRRDFDAELAVVRDLRQAGTAPVSDDRTRQRVAVRIAEKMALPAGTENSEPVRPTRRRRLRPALAAALCLLAGLGGLAVLLSGSALPGDLLYPVKRAGESTVLALTFDERQRARQRLAYAADRLDELGKLAERDGDPARRAAAHTAGLADFDNAVRAASVTLTTTAADSTGDQLRTLRAWTVRQADELAGLAPALPPAAAGQQTNSLALLDRVEHRAAALHERIDCYRITSGTSDELGALPATGPCVAPGKDAREQRVPTTAPEPPPVTTRPPPDTLVSSPVAAQPATPTPQRQEVRELTRVPAVTTTRPPLRFEPIAPTPAPPEIDRPRIPSDAGDAAPSATGVVRDLVDDVLDVPLGE